MPCNKLCEVCYEIHKKRIIFVFAILTMALVLSCALVACDKSSQKQELSASEIYSSVDSSVVFILISTRSGYSSGSGFFIDNNGTVVTNYHVIEDGLSGVIQKNDGKTATIDKVLGFDKKLDIAILATSATNTKPVAISKTPVQVGDTVYAIGYPEAFKLGFTSSTFTTGIVSMNRSIDGYSYIQSTVNITHGNSGGTLINKSGEVIGITTAGITYSNIDYMNLSIPIQRIDTVSRNVNVPLDVVTKRNYPVYATFYSDGTKYTSQSVRYEGYVYEPTAPTKTGYSFAGWYADSSFNTKFNFNTKLTSNVSIYAKWTINTYNINYNLNFGKWDGSSPSKTYTINDCEKTLPSPVRTGYIFEGWKNASGDYISKLPTSSYLDDLSLTASWVEGTEGLTFITRHSGTVYVIVTGYTGNSANVVIPTTYRGVPVECINASAFKNQTQLISISLPDSLTSIESNAFAGCMGLTSITIPNSVTSIGDWAFFDCRGLTSITIPDSVTSIGDRAFRDCTRLTSVTIPGSVTSIGNSAFYSCYRLIEVYNKSTLSITAGSSSNGYVAYYAKNVYKNEGGSKLTTDENGYVIYTDGDEKILVAYHGTNTELALPSYITKINQYAFYNCTGLTSVTIGKGVTLIGNSAFRDCTGLTNITIPDSVTSIGGGAFYGCTEFTTVNWNAIECTSAGSSESPIFKGCSNLATVNIGDNVKIIPSFAFHDCTGLTSVVIPNSVTSIGDYAFRNCTELTSVTIPDSVTSIGESAFYDCTGLTTVNWNATECTSAGSSDYPIFKGCSNLATVNIGDNVKIIPSYAFKYCTGLTNITIPDSVTSIGREAFSFCTRLTSVTIGGSVTSIGYSAFWGCTGLTSVTIPDSVTSIGDGAFSYCTGLTSIKFNGTKAQWNAISKGYRWKYNVPSECNVVCTDGTISI